MTLTLAELQAAPDLPTEQAQQLMDSIAFWGEERAALRLMTPEQCAHVMAERKRMGRPLECDEVLAAMEAAHAAR